MFVSEIFDRYLQTRTLGRHPIYLEVISSTSAYLKEHASDLPAGTVVLAQAQTHGYGSNNRVWESPGGGLYMSVLLPWMPLSLLPLEMGLAVREALSQIGVEVSLKWPNDLVFDGRKLGGILLEGRSSQWVIAGLGLNLNPCNVIDSVSLSEAGVEGCIEELAARILNCFESLLAADEGTIIERWEQASCTIGQRICVTSHETSISGLAIGLDSQGGLRVKLPSNEIIPVYSGTLRLFDGRYA